MFFPKRLFKDLGLYAITISIISIISRNIGFTDISHIAFSHISWDILLFGIGYLGAAYILNYFGYWNE